jgi:uncharacterized cupin superfamily protein
MPKLDLAAIPVLARTGYPAVFAAALAGRSFLRLGDAGGLTQFGVNLVTLQPGAWASQRHWHEQEDEFVMVLSGELVMIDDQGEHEMRAGDCATHKAGDGNGHHLVNRSGAVATFLVVGTRSTIDHAHYPDVDMQAIKDESGSRFVHRDGTPY